MKHRSFLPLFVRLCSLLLGTVPLLHAQTDVRPAPGGQRILFVDGDDIRPAPGGKRLLFIDGGKELRPEPGGKLLLTIDADGDVRHTWNGIRIAYWDGWSLRRAPRSPELLFVDGDDVRPTMGGPRLLFFDGPKLSRAQVTAVLYVLKPEFFKLTPEETATKQKEMSDNGAGKGATGDPWLGSHAILAHNTNAAKRAGSIIVTKQADYYGITYKTGEEPAWQGIALNVALPGSRTPELWAAVGPGGASSLGVYEVSGNSLRGVWVPVNATQDRSLLGYENLNGPAELGGVYKVVSGKLPNGGAAYTGDLNIDPLPARMSGNAKCYRIRWTTGTTAVGFQIQTKLAVAAGWGADCEILRFRLENTGIVVDALNKAGAQANYLLQK
jgi:hypothetical protein